MARCVAQALSKADARQTARAVERHVRLRTTVAWCEACDGYHVDYASRSGGNGSTIDQFHMEVLQKMAMGLNDMEIAHDLSTANRHVTDKMVWHAQNRLRRRLNAMSRANLVAIAIALRVINPLPYVAGIKPKETTTRG
jgi:DNA-binding CsgD family transcriptional regulator